MPTKKLPTKRGLRYKCIWSDHEAFQEGIIYTIETDRGDFKSEYCVGPETHKSLFTFVQVPTEIKYKN